MENIVRAVDAYRQLILDAERYIWAHPETGYKEVETSKYLAEQFEALGYKLTYADGITGFLTEVDTGKPGPTVLVLGELDSIICPAHKEANPETGAVHSCGHNAQCAALLGVAAALTEKSVLDGLTGKIRLCAVPAEELLEIEYRSKLKADGKIKYFGGKSEFLYRGYFDGVDIALMVHTAKGYTARLGSVGCIAKRIIYKGTAAHAGGAPWAGKNALYAATCGLSAANAVRETFHDTDLIRFHPIITHGGDMVNAIPEEVTLESYIRGKTFEAMDSANKRVNQALIGAAYSLNTNIEIIDMPGYSPLVNDSNMIEVAKDAYELLYPGEKFNIDYAFSTGSTDMGDLSSIMPVVHPYCGGSDGKSHGNDYQIVNPEIACVDCAKWQVIMLKLILENGAERGKRIISEHKPLFPSAKAFLDYQDSINTSGDRIVYHDDGTAILKNALSENSDAEEKV
ncbi:MAG: amidohydrolase [Ruminococcaceae bacterium]|nr:amidohydrolase [Oscillospiraceae bacterium]